MMPSFRNLNGALSSTTTQFCGQRFSGANSEDPLSEFLPEAGESPTGIMEIVPATFLTEAAPSLQPRNLRRARHTRTRVMERATTVYRTNAGRIVPVVQAVSRMLRNASLVLLRLNTCTQLPANSARYVSAVARVQRHGLTQCSAFYRALPIRLSAYQARFSGIDQAAVKSRLLSFGGGIAVGMAVIWAVDLQLLTNIAGVQKPPAAERIPVRPHDRVVGVPPGLSLPERPGQSIAFHPVAATLGPGARNASSRERPTSTTGVAAAPRVSVASTFTAAKPQEFRGTLAIDSVVPGAHVFINGDPIGRTPLLLKSVSIGSRAVRIEAPGYRTWSASVQVTANQQTRIRPRLDPVTTETRNNPSPGR